MIRKQQPGLESKKLRSHSQDPQKLEAKPKQKPRDISNVDVRRSKRVQQQKAQPQGKVISEENKNLSIEV